MYNDCIYNYLASNWHHKMRFVGRKTELLCLESFYRSPRASLLILYGRRRFNKTRLITHFLDRHNENPHFYLVATTHSEGLQLRDFPQAILH